jgi:hypothetical protein
MSNTPQISSIDFSVFQNTPMEKNIIEMMPRYISMLPKGASFEDPTWNAASWSKRQTSVKTLNFARIGNVELIQLTKTRALEMRLHKHVSYNAIENIITATCALATVMQSRSAKTLTTGDFRSAEKLLAKNYGPGTAARYSSELERIASWMRGVLGLPIEHKRTLKSHNPHGRKSMAKNREDKLIPTEIISEFLSHRNRNDISTRDSFYLNALALQVACGMRAGEMATLPVDCLIDDEGALLVRNFTSKGGRSAPRPVPPQLAPMVREAVKALTVATEAGRREAKRIGDSQPLDWDAILKDEEARDYFLRIEAHKWTINPNHLIINPSGVWNQNKKKFYDVIGILERADGNLSQASRVSGIDRNTFNRMLDEQRASKEGRLSERSLKRTTWDGDQRIFTIMTLVSICGTTNVMRDRAKENAFLIVQETQKAQLSGITMPMPSQQSTMENKFRQTRPVALKTTKGKPILLAEDALFVIEKNSLSETKTTKEEGIHLITPSDLSGWLTGEKRSYGTGNFEDAAASRLGIIDPRTGEHASFTWHDIRHWLNTTYENGGLSQDQISMMFNRRSTAGNSPYSHTSNEVRADQLRDSIREKKTEGHITRAAAALADVDRTKAEAYLKATTRTHNPMPHGVCTLNWAAEPCPHHLSCFSCHSDPKTQDPVPCEHLVVDLNDPSQKQEIERLRASSEETVQQMDNMDLHESPQFQHHSRVVKATAHILKRTQS